MLGHSSRATKCAANGNLAATAVVFDTPKSLTPASTTPPLSTPHTSVLYSIRFSCIGQTSNVPVLHWCLRGELKFEGNLFSVLFFWTIFGLFYCD